MIWRKNLKNMRSMSRIVGIQLWAPTVQCIDADDEKFGNLLWDRPWGEQKTLPNPIAKKSLMLDQLWQCQNSRKDEKHWKDIYSVYLTRRTGETGETKEKRQKGGRGKGVIVGKGKRNREDSRAKKNRRDRRGKRYRRDSMYKRDIMTFEFKSDWYFIFEEQLSQLPFFGEQTYWWYWWRRWRWWWRWRRFRRRRRRWWGWNRCY